MCRGTLPAVVFCAALVGHLASCTEEGTPLGVDTVQVSVNATPAGSGSGTITSSPSPADFECQIEAGIRVSGIGSCSASFDDAGGGGIIHVTASPAAGSVFAGWDEAFCNADHSDECVVDCGLDDADPSCDLSFTATVGRAAVYQLTGRFELEDPTSRDIVVNVAGAGLGEGIVFTPMNGTWLLCGIVAGHTNGLCSFERLGFTGAGSVEVIAAREGTSEFQGWDNQSCTAENNPFACEFDCVANPDGEVCELIWDEDSGDVTFDMTARFESTLGTVVIEDDFNDAGACADWSSDVAGNGTYSATNGCEAAGGNPDGYRTMTHEVTDVSGVNVSHWYEGGSYDPSSGGAIEEIIYSESLIITQPAFVGGAVGSYFRLRQGGTVYTHSLGAHTDTGWTDHSVRLTPVFFTPAPGPDFSAAGSEIQFGYGRSNSNTTAGATSTTVHGIDNWRVVIVQSP